MTQPDRPDRQAELPRWLKPLAAGSGPRYLQIVEMIDQGILKGWLHPGDRLPPQRKLAELLSVDLTTVTRAYAEARHRHLLEATGGQGSYISRTRHASTWVADLSLNIPPSPSPGRLNMLLQQGMTEVLSRHDADSLMTYHGSIGNLADRAAGAAWLEPMLGPLHTDRIAVCPGAQAALAALILTHTAPGDAIACEPLAYPGLILAAQQLGRRLLSVDCDTHGMSPQALDDLCRNGQIRLLYLNPTLQNPTTHTLPEHRRQALAEVIRRHDLAVIEDDPYWPLAHMPPPPLAQWAPGQVCYVSTLSKCLSPGLRTAYVGLPAATDMERFAQALRSLALMPSPLMGALSSQWIRDGIAEELCQGVKLEAEARQRLAATLLPQAEHIPGHGIHIWHPLASPSDLNALVIAASSHGLALSPSQAFAIDDQAPSAIRLSLGGVAERAQLEAALRVLASLMTRSLPLRPGGII